MNDWIWQWLNKPERTREQLIDMAWSARQGWDRTAEQLAIAQERLHNLETRVRDMAAFVDNEARVS